MASMGYQKNLNREILGVEDAIINAGNYTLTDIERDLDVQPIGEYENKMHLEWVKVLDKCFDLIGDFRNKYNVPR